MYVVYVFMHAQMNECMDYLLCVCAYVINLNLYQDDRRPLASFIILIQDRECIACVVDCLLKIVNLSFISIKFSERKFCLLGLYFSGKLSRHCFYAV
jgi:hypothetical protein